MATVGKELVDQIVANNGYYSDDPRVARIVEYTNAWGGVSYGIEYSHEVGKYSASEWVINPKVHWEAGNEIDS